MNKKADKTIRCESAILDLLSRFSEMGRAQIIEETGYTKSQVIHALEYLKRSGKVEVMTDQLWRLAGSGAGLCQYQKKVSSRVWVTEEEQREHEFYRKKFLESKERMEQGKRWMERRKDGQRWAMG